MSQAMLLENKVIFILEDIIAMEVKVTLPAGEAEYFSRYNDFTAG
jgi:hypothetical protein